MLGYSGMLDPAVFMASLEHKFAAKGTEIVELNRKALNKGLEIGALQRSLEERLTIKSQAQK